MRASLQPVLRDSFGREIRDLRISVTDRCNFRCLYCLPETEEAADFFRAKGPSGSFHAVQTPITRLWKAKSEILTFEEIERVARIFASLGVHKLRLTGGEPLLRTGIEDLIGRLARIDGIHDLAMTSNGFLFGKKALAMKTAGLRRMSFSMDSLDRANFKRMTGRDGLHEVLEGIRLAKESGFNPVKVNAVVIRDLNDREIEPLADFAREQEVVMRFIEFMPLDSSKAWQKELVVSGREIRERLQRRFALDPVAPKSRSETAQRWRFRDANAEIGIIASVTEPFCGHCNRIRLTADGMIRTCLFSREESDVKALLRKGASDQEIREQFHQWVRHKEAGHRIGKPDFVQPERTMSCIGG